MSKKYLYLVIIVIYTLIIFLPPIIHGYVYPNNSDDSALHIRFFEALQGGDGGTIQYWGQLILGYPLVWFSNLTNISVSILFMWFNFIVLWLIGIMAFFLLKSVLNWQAGFIGMFLVTFGTSSTLNLFDTGAIYDLVVVGIIAPFFLYCTVKFITNKHWWWAVLAVFVLAFSFAFHSMVIRYIFGTNVAENSPSFLAFSGMVGSAVMVLGIMAVIFLVYKNVSVKLDTKRYVLLGGFILLVAILAVFSFTNLTSYPYRFAIDLAIILTLLIAYLCGLLLENYKHKYLNVLIVVAVLLVSFANINTYFHNNSAIKEADKQAIAYLNTLDGKYFSCSPNVAAWVYERFTDKRYKKGELPYITRNESMTYKTTEGSPYFWAMPAYKITSEMKTDNSYVFRENGIVIIVYSEEDND